MSHNPIEFYDYLDCFFLYLINIEISVYMNLVLVVLSVHLDAVI